MTFRNDDVLVKKTFFFSQNDKNRFASPAHIRYIHQVCVFEKYHYVFFSLAKITMLKKKIQKSTGGGARWWWWWSSTLNPSTTTTSSFEK